MKAPHNLRLHCANFDVVRAKKNSIGSIMVELMEVKLLCGAIGFLFIGAMLGMVIGLNAPPVEEKDK